MDILSGFADISLAQLLLVAVVALVASVIGGVSGYGNGALMPLILVPMVGAAPVVPIIAISALFNNFGRVSAFFKYLDRRRAIIGVAASLPTCVLGAWGYTFLTGNGAALVIGSMLILSVPLRRLLKHHEVRVGDRGFAFGAVGYGVVVGGTAGSGVIMLSLLMAAGLEGAAVVATDAAISIVVSVTKVLVFGFAGVLSAQTIALALLIGVIAFPGAFLARLFVERMPVHVHTAILDFIVLLGGAMMIVAAFR
ncbi:MAG: TSUP family transporter [Hyphomicrobiales bacterium]|nr:TSUP family transporter [Hyphomicrobiales bacterium]